MGYSFRHMNEEWARTIKTWKYDGEYSIYSYEKDTNIQKPENWKYIFAVFNDEAGTFRAPFIQNTVLSCFQMEILYTGEDILC